MLDLLTQQQESDLALLEVSSFQLEHTSSFAPNLAIWTNFYPNHLDRHDSELEYRNAKAKLLSFQSSSQQALVPWELRDIITSQGFIHYFANHKPSDEMLARIHPTSSVYYFNGDSINCFNNQIEQQLIYRNSLPPLSYEENWLIICAALHILALPLTALTAVKITLPEHRLEKIATINGVDFYNDSKSTTPQSTLAAVKRLNKAPILLLLGGMSKGVDRAWLINDLRGQVKKIYCFGKEAEQLKQYCDSYSIESIACKNLDEAVKEALCESCSGDQVLLSPAGASFDLFANYIERGIYFKKIVNELTALK
jgi:UDP-N-acetylmuramoylalanine--D-glutamate ligase